jgi:hypothetical protein
MRIESRHRKAIAALVRGLSTSGAAAEVGVSAMTVVRWRRDPDFQAAYKDAIRRVFGDGIDRLQAVTRKAVRTLQECLGAAKASDRIKAADRLLAHGLRAAELKDLAERVEALEALLAARQVPGRPNGAAAPQVNGGPGHGRA